MKSYTSKDTFIVEQSTVEPDKAVELELSRYTALELADMLQEALEAQDDALSMHFANGTDLYISFKALDVPELEAMPPNYRFARGIVRDDNTGVNKANTGENLDWVAIRGEEADWTIYIDSPTELGEPGKLLLDPNNKLHDEKHITKLVNCTPAALGAYRH